MVYSNVKYVIATRSYDFFTYTQNLTFEGCYTCSICKLRHKEHQQVWKCSLAFLAEWHSYFCMEIGRIHMLESRNWGGGTPRCVPWVIRVEWKKKWTIEIQHQPKVT